MKILTIYTDGSCYYKDKLGGWGAVITVDGVQMEISGSKSNTTSNRMELTAALKALRLIKTPSKIKLYSDSMYVVNGIKAKGWLGKQDLKNADLWRHMSIILNHHRVKPIWVRGHSGVEGNERADHLAGQGRKALLIKRNKKILDEIIQHNKRG